MQIIRRIKRSIKGENKFRKVANEWLEYKKNSIKNSTYYNYKFIIEKYLNKEFGEQNVEKIKDYNQYIQELTKKLASKTIRDIICVLKAILKYYEEENDCKLKYKRMNIPKLEKKEIKILSSTIADFGILNLFILITMCGNFSVILSLQIPASFSSR